LDRRLAYLLLRLTLGINMLLHGAVRLPALGAFTAGMVQQFADTPLPAMAVRLFGLVLPLITTLVFGTALRSDGEALSIQMLYAIIYYLLLAARTDDYFALDTLRTKRPGPSTTASE
jgi:thiosulfate dehydrogenase (quinone) large subunit